MSKRTINHVLILGATSDLATALAAQFAMREYTVTLAGRDLDKLSVIGSDIHIRYSVPVNILRFDALDFKSHQEFYHSIKHKPDVVICVFGLLGDQQIAQNDWSEAARILDSNYTGAVSILNVV